MNGALGTCFVLKRSSPHRGTHQALVAFLKGTKIVAENRLKRLELFLRQLSPLLQDNPFHVLGTRRCRKGARIRVIARGVGKSVAEIEPVDCYRWGRG